MSSARAIAAAALLAMGGGCAQSSPPRAISDGRLAMGTLLEISLEGVDARRAARALDDAFAEALRLDGLLSIYDPASEISGLNRAAGRGLQPVDPAVAEILALSIRYAELTAGAFDVTVGPLVDLWRRAAERGAPPSSAELAAARARVGAQQIQLAPGQAALADAGAMLDLGGIAKGYALDRMLPLLERRGVTRALLSFGQSSIWAIGAPEQLDGWRLFVRAPDGAPAGLITLRDQALSVSGSQGQWVEIGGRRYGHIIDPRSGAPLMVARQALVVAPSATLAEALSVALLVLDAQAGLALVAAQAGCEALLIESGGELRSTAGWQAAARFEPLSPPPPPPAPPPPPRPGARG